jgi:hypothetical protein
MSICGLLFQWGDMSICGLLFQWGDMSICGLLFQWGDMSISGLLFQWGDMSISGLLFQWGDMSFCGLLFQLARTIKIQLSMLVWYKVDLIIISLKINLFSPWYSWKIAELALNNNHSWKQRSTFVLYQLKLGLIKIYPTKISDAPPILYFFECKLGTFISTLLFYASVGTSDTHLSGNNHKFKILF